MHWQMSMSNARHLGGFLLHLIAEVYCVAKEVRMSCSWFQWAPSNCMDIEVVNLC